MASDKNIFGGANAAGLYTPMSEDEQEVISRLIAARELNVVIVGWGSIEGVQATQGDLRVQIPIQIVFNRPEVPQPVFYFDLELRTRSGILLFKERQSTVYENAPLMIGTGTQLSMIWDIAVKAIDPELVKMYKPRATGLTSRWIDRDTGQFTHLGNTRMSAEERKALDILRQGEELSRRHTASKAKKAGKLSKGKKR